MLLAVFCLSLALIQEVHPQSVNFDNDVDYLLAQKEFVNSWNSAASRNGYGEKTAATVRPFLGPIADLPLPDEQVKIIQGTSSVWLAASELCKVMNSKRGPQSENITVTSDPNELAIGWRASDLNIKASSPKVSLIIIIVKSLPPIQSQSPVAPVGGPVGQLSPGHVQPTGFVGGTHTQQNVLDQHMQSAPVQQPSVMPGQNLQGQQFPAQSQGFPAQSQGFPAQSQGFSPQSQGFSPQIQGFLAQSQGFPAQSQGFPPQSQGFPPQSQGFSPQSQGFPTQGQGFPVQGQGFPPQSQGFPIQNHGMVNHQLFPTQQMQGQGHVMPGQTVFPNQQGQQFPGIQGQHANQFLQGQHSINQPPHGQGQQSFEVGLGQPGQQQQQQQSFEVGIGQGQTGQGQQQSFESGFGPGGIQGQGGGQIGNNQQSFEMLGGGGPIEPLPLHQLRHRG